MIQPLKSLITNIVHGRDIHCPDPREYRLVLESGEDVDFKVFGEFGINESSCPNSRVLTLRKVQEVN